MPIKINVPMTMLGSLFIVLILPGALKISLVHGINVEVS